MRDAYSRFEVRWRIPKFSRTSNSCAGSTSETMKKVIDVIIGSTRPNRIGAQVAEWVFAILSRNDALTFELVDLATWHLPLSDEPRVPASGEYLHDHTKAWSRKIDAADGFVFVTPQYNWGYPASLKNALDHLFKEWAGKPAVIVSYGHHGGTKAAAQLRQVLEALRMQPTPTMPAITFTNQMLAESGSLKDPATDFARYAPSVETALTELAARLLAPRK
jgi:NAD(P)H-dependent FMN reductase